MNKFNLKKGGCTVYAFFCGYGDVIINNDFDLSLFHNCGSGYDVKLRDNKRGINACWLTFESVTDARAMFKTIKNIISEGIA
jgi:hypothetical protein